MEDLREGSLSVAVGEEAAPGPIVEWLVDNGYGSAPQVQLPGQYCLRGGILDVYSHGAPEPVRVEFFGDSVDSIRTFDPFSQLSTGRVQRCQITVPERPPGGEGASAGSLLSFFAPDATVLIVGPERLWHRAETIYEQSDRRDLLTPPQELEPALAQHPHVVFRSDEEEGAQDVVRITCRLKDSFGPDLDSTLVELDRICKEHEETYVYCTSPAEAERFEALLKDSGFEAPERLQLGIGRLNHGALFPEAGLALVPHHRLFHRYRQRRLISHVQAARPVAAVEELEVGGLVVHIQHGIAKFLGTRVLDQEGRKREHLELEFADKVRVYVPADRIEMVHRYIGVGAHRPELSKLRGATWQHAKERAEEAVEDLAAELLELQAIRETQPGIAAPADSDWLREFESEFPYEETDDQLRAIEDVKTDMGAPRPMDRLICGDVGYGKTEVAMRAAFKAVLGGRQVAVLVPTTVLAAAALPHLPRALGRLPRRASRCSAASAPPASARRCSKAWPTARWTSSSARTGCCRRTSPSRTWAWSSLTRSSASASSTRRSSSSCGRRWTC